MAVDSHTAISLAKSMGLSIMASLEHPTEGSPTGGAIDPKHILASIIHGLANDIQAILGDALEKSTSMFPHKPPATPNRNTLPQHLWPKSVRHDISNN